MYCPVMYFCQFSELDTATYVGHRRLLCRGGAGPHGVYGNLVNFQDTISPMGNRIPLYELKGSFRS